MALKKEHVFATKKINSFIALRKNIAVRKVLLYNRSTPRGIEFKLKVVFKRAKSKSDAISWIRSHVHHNDFIYYYY